jgi:hypothetical protein
VLQLLLDDIVEEEPQLDVEDGRDAIIKASTTRNMRAQSQSRWTKRTRRRGCRIGARAIPEENTARDGGARLGSFSMRIPFDVCYCAYPTAAFPCSYSGGTLRQLRKPATVNLSRKRLARRCHSRKKL